MRGGASVDAIGKRRILAHPAACETAATPDRDLERGLLAVAASRGCVCQEIQHQGQVVSEMHHVDRELRHGVCTARLSAAVTVFG